MDNQISSNDIVGYVNDEPVISNGSSPNYKCILFEIERQANKLIVSKLVNSRLAIIVGLSSQLFKLFCDNNMIEKGRLRYVYEFFVIDDISGLKAYVGK